jgi:hypothetical protein
MPLRTVGLLRVPIQYKGLEVIAVFDLMLPAIRPTRRPDHSDMVLALRRDQEVGIHVATIKQVGPRQQSTSGQVGFNRRPHHTIRCRGRRGEHLRDPIGVLRLTGLREVELRAHPMGVAFTAVARIQVVG